MMRSFPPKMGSRSQGFRVWVLLAGGRGGGQAAELAAANRIKMSSHLFPEASAHLLAATPTCHYLEYVDWANVLLQEPLAITDGQAIVPERPGTGMVWNEEI